MVEDLASVVEIEGQQSSGWNRKMLESELLAAGGIQLAARSTAAVVGWTCGRRVGAEAELLKIAVDNDWCRQGIGTRLLNSLVGRYVAEGVEKMFLEVRLRNQVAVGFYREYGFIEVGRRKGYYKKPLDDAVVMVLNVHENGHEDTIR